MINDYNEYPSTCAAIERPEKNLEINENTPILKINFSLRTKNCLIRAKEQGYKLEILKDLCNITADELMLLKNFGKVSLEEVKCVLRWSNLSLKDSPIPIKQETPYQFGWFKTEDTNLPPKGKSVLGCDIGTNGPTYFITHLYRTNSAKREEEWHHYDYREKEDYQRPDFWAPFPAPPDENSPKKT